MPYLQHEDRRIPLQEGDNRVVGAEAGNDASAGATLTVDGPRGASVRPGSADSVVEVNGALVGAQPVALLHGDRVRVDGAEYVFCDDNQTGPTLRVEAAEETAGAGAPEPPAPRARSNGRVISLTDGREYAVHADGLWIGRDAGCDIVVSSRDVSRRHARIELAPDGYLLRDVSMNGVRVNGGRIGETHPLAIGDVIRVGPEDMRFHGTAADGEDTPPMLPMILQPRPVETPAQPIKAVSPASETPTQPIRAVRPPAQTPPAPVAAADESVVRTLAIPSATRPTEPTIRPVLATLEILNSGPAKGTRFTIETHLLHIGRGAHNDIRVPEESVSDLHAKLQRRADGWHVIDLGSTNGTFVGGERVHGEALVPAGAELRVGSVKMRFRVGDGGGGGAESGVQGGLQDSTDRERGTIIPSWSPALRLLGGGRRRIVVVAVILLATIAVFLLVRMP